MASFFHYIGNSFYFKWFIRLLKRLKGTFFLFGLLFPFFRLLNYYFIFFNPFHFTFLFFLFAWVFDWFLSSCHMIYLNYVFSYVFYGLEGFWLKSFTFLFDNFFVLPFFLFLITCFFWVYPFWLNIYIFFYVLYLAFVFLFFRCFFTARLFLFPEELYYSRGFISLYVYSELRDDLHKAQEISASFSLKRFGFVRPYNFNFEKNLVHLENKSFYPSCSHITFTRYRYGRFLLFLLFVLNTIFGLFVLKSCFFL